MMDMAFLEMPVSDQVKEPDMVLVLLAAKTAAGLRTRVDLLEHLVDVGREGFWKGHELVTVKQDT